MREFTIQRFTGYHDDSCARLNACINSRLVRGHELQGGTKTLCTSALRQVGCLAVEELTRLQQEWQTGPQPDDFRGVLFRCSPLGLLFPLLSYLARQGN